MRKAISLFSGAGGLDLGLHAAGFSARAVVECDRDALATIQKPDNSQWWQGTEIVAKKIECVPSDELLEAARLRKGEATILVGGPPCQPFSKSGYWHSGDSKRLADPRANTLREYLRVLEDTLPEVFLLENVPGLAFSQKSDGLQLLRDSLQDINKLTGSNYKIHAAQLNTVDYGVPQTRERVFVIGHRDGKAFEFPKPTHTRPPRVDMANGAVTVEDPAEGTDLKPFINAWDAIGHLVGQNDPGLELKGKFKSLLPSIPEGQNYLFHTDRGRGKRIFGWRTRYWSMLLKLAKARPSWTLTAQPGPAIGPFHWENRRLSGEELCALQTFPAGYQIAGDVMAAHKQLGNAVPSAMAEVLGMEIRRQLLGERMVSSSPTLLPTKRDDLPPPGEPGPVPPNWRDLRSKNLEDHPGTGKGPGAQLRDAVRV